MRWAELRERARGGAVTWPGWPGGRGCARGVNKFAGQGVVGVPAAFPGLLSLTDPVTGRRSAVPYPAELVGPAWVEGPRCSLAGVAAPQGSGEALQEGTLAFAPRLRKAHLWAAKNRWVLPSGY